MLDFNLAEPQTLEPPSLAAAALGYATRGLPVFPCSIDKKPLTASGFKDATADQEQIRQWWTRHPGASIGIPTGADTGCFVLDVDMPDGPATLERLEQENGPLPATREQRTGSGGRHLFFTHPGWTIRNSARKLGAGLDTRGDGGYVILPPSQHPSGNQYEWINASHPIAEAPAWLLEKLTERQAEKPAPIATGGEYGRAALARELAELTGAAEGSRNSRLNTAAFSLGQLVAGGELDRGQVEAALAAAAVSIGLPHQEVAATIASGLEGGSREPRTAPEKKPATLPPAPTGDNAAQGQPEARVKPLFITASELVERKTVIQKLVGKLIERGCTGQIFGPSGDGKTFVALDLFLSVATGTEWNGIQCEQGLAVYFNGEGHSGFMRRLKAWHQHRGKPDMSNALVSESKISFDDAGLRQVIAEVRAIENSTGKRVALIVIDTLARHIQGDENSTADMGRFVESVDSLRQEFPESTAMVVHHTGNDPANYGRSRGSGSIRGACDFEIQCLKGCLTFLKVKDGEEPPPTEFKLRQVAIGTDEETGEPITSCVVQYGERSHKNRQETLRLTAAERTLRAMVESNPGILIGDFRANYYDRVRKVNPEAKTNTIKNAFLRAFQGLTEKGVIYEADDAVYLQESDRHSVTKASQNSFCDGLETVTGVTHPYKGVTFVTPSDDAPVWATEDL